MTSFVDDRGLRCSVEEAGPRPDDDAVVPRVWIGSDLGGPPRLLLSQELVRKLLPLFEHFVEDGHLPPDHASVDSDEDPSEIGAHSSIRVLCSAIVHGSSVVADRAKLALFAKVGACCNELDGPCEGCGAAHGHTCIECDAEYCGDCFSTDATHRNACSRFAKST